MKNRVIISVVILLLLTIGLVACTPAGGDKSVCAQINEMVALDYQTIKLSVYTTQNGITLTSEFHASITDLNTMVSYSVETLNTFTTDQDGNYVAPSTMISKKTGSAIIKDGVIVETAGQAVNIPVESLQNISLNFSETVFSDINTYADGTDNVFEAKVTSPALFTNNWDFDGKDMRVQVRYGEKLNLVNISYVSAKEASVQVIYSFK
ncbi:MAG: hypothetical protein J6V83_03190 [Clostridia bacterium]|nr:hypothetical protein [Clostridia bacterium]